MVSTSKLIEKISLPELYSIINQKKAARQTLVLDIRTEAEHKLGCIDKSRNIPISELENQLKYISSFNNVVVYCFNGGSRSEKATSIIKGNGISAQVSILDGGVHNWQKKGFKLSKPDNPKPSLWQRLNTKVI